MPKTRYNPFTKSYRPVQGSDVILLPGRTAKPAGDNYMNGSPFGPFNPNQPIDGTAYKEPKKSK